MGIRKRLLLTFGKLAISSSIGIWDLHLSEALLFCTRGRSQPVHNVAASDPKASEPEIGHGCHINKGYNML